jgi:hypothetical protein
MACTGEKISIQGLVQKPENMRPLGRPRCRYEDNIQLDLTELE